MRKIPAKLGVRGPHVHAHSLTIHTHAGPSNNPNVLFPAEAELSACLVVVVSFVVCGSRQRICFVNQISGCYWGTKRWPLFAFPAEPGHMLGLFPFFNLPATKTSFSTTHNTEGFFTSTSWNRGCLRLGRLVPTEQAETACVREKFVVVLPALHCWQGSLSLLIRERPAITWVHSSVVRAADCRSAGPWFKSGCALIFHLCLLWNIKDNPSAGLFKAVALGERRLDQEWTSVMRCSISYALCLYSATCLYPATPSTDKWKSRNASLACLYPATLLQPTNGKAVMQAFRTYSRRDSNPQSPP